MRSDKGRRSGAREDDHAHEHPRANANGSTPPPQPTVYVASDEGLLYKPRKMSYYGGAQVVERIPWMSYGGPTAVARAVYAYNTCKLGCAGGPYTHAPITLTLLNRQLCRGSTAVHQVVDQRRPRYRSVAGSDGTSPEPPVVAEQFALAV